LDSEGTTLRAGETKHFRLTLGESLSIFSEEIRNDNVASASLPCAAREESERAWLDRRGRRVAAADQLGALGSLIVQNLVPSVVIRIWIAPNTGYVLKTPALAYRAPSKLE
jgi:hypothetical protein